jgi:hypothetical protein
MTIKTEEISEDPSIPVETTTEATTATPDQSSAGGIDIGWTLGLGTSTYIESFLMISLEEEHNKAQARLFELLKPPAFLQEQDNKSSFLIPAGERDTMKIKYWLDVYQLLSMRQLICRATYGEDERGVKYTYTCAHEECSGYLTFIHSSRDGILRGGLISLGHEPNPFEHTCSPHCQWGTAGSLPSEFKPQGFVLSPALRFAIVAQFLYQQELEDLWKKSTETRAARFGTSTVRSLFCRGWKKTTWTTWTVDEKTSEGLRLQMNHKLGLEVTQGQWKETLLSFCRVFLSRRIDRRDVNELTPYHFWMLYHGYKVMGSPFWFGTKVRDTDTARVWWLKTIYLWTAFPVLTILQCVVTICAMYLNLLLACAALFLCLPCICYDMHTADKENAAVAKENAARYGRDGVEVPGHVSDRWVKPASEHQSITYLMTVTYFEKDGTMIDKRFVENPRGPNDCPYEEESVPVLVLPDTPGSGIPKRMIQDAILRSATLL